MFLASPKIRGVSLCIFARFYCFEGVLFFYTDLNTPKTELRMLTDS